MTQFATASVECPHCRELAPQRVVQQPGHDALLWCELCFRVTIAHRNLSLPIDPLALSPALSVDVAELDADHERLIDILNDVHAAAKAGRRDDLKALTGHLLDELMLHLEREEALLRAWTFPGLDEHQDQHGAMHDRMHALVQELLAGTRDVADIGRSMKFCLVGHLADDLKYKDFLGERRGRNGVLGWVV